MGQVVTDNKFRQMSFGYDANGRMVKATKANAPDALSVYDSLGNRVATKVNDVWQFVIYDAFGKLVAEYGGMSATDEGGVKYVLSDWQGSVRASLSNSGYVKSRTDYQAFGEEIQSGIGMRSSAQGFGGGTGTRQGYGLTEKDEASGLNHTWFRKNENRAGRWTSPDPYNGSASLGNPQSFNRYSYVENQPTNFVDPSGLFQLVPRPMPMSSLELCWRLGICGNPGSQGGLDEPPGGGGANPNPDPPCSITIAFGGDQVGGEMELPNAPGSLGPQATLGIGVAANVEITGRFTKPYPENVILNQRVTSSSVMLGTVKYGDVYLQHVLKYKHRYNEDDTNPSRNYYDSENGVAYANDGPGLYMNNPTVGASGIWEGTFTTYYSEKNDKGEDEIKCHRQWHVRITAQNGRITSSKIGYGPLP